MSNNNNNNNNNDRVADALENAAQESVIYQSEVQVDAMERARKRLRVRKEEPEEEEEREIDGSDAIRVLGHCRSLMWMVRSLGLEYTKKNLKNLSISDKYYAKLSLNSVVDLNDQHYMQLLGLSEEAVEPLKSFFAVPAVVVPVPGEDLVRVYEEARDMTYQQTHKHFLLSSFGLNGASKQKLRILAEVHKVLGQKSSFLQKWKSASEWTLIIKIWSSLFECLFEDTDLDLVWGDTRGGLFKVDLRVCVDVGGVLLDVSNVEFKKNGDAQQSVLSDKAKVILEGKGILNALVEAHNLNIEQAKGQKAVVVQVCGLQAVFTEMGLVAPGCYMPAQLGNTIKYPTSKERARRFAEFDLQQLFLYKDLVLAEAKKLKEETQNDFSSFGSFLKQQYVLQDTAIKWPEVNNDLFRE